MSGVEIASSESRRSCITSSPRRPRARRLESWESATRCSSSSTNTGITSSRSMNPVAITSAIRPSMIAEVSTTVPRVGRTLVVARRRPSAARRPEARPSTLHRGRRAAGSAGAGARRRARRRSRARGTAAAAGSRRRTGARRSRASRARRRPRPSRSPTPPTTSSPADRRCAAPSTRRMACTTMPPSRNATSQPAAAPPTTTPTQRAQVPASRTGATCPTAPRPAPQQALPGGRRRVG